MHIKIRETMATKRSCRWPHILHPASILPYNTGDWMNFANRHPLQIFAFLPTSSHQSGEYPDSCLEDSFMTIFPILSTLSSSGSCHIYETIAFLFHLSQNTISYNYYNLWLFFCDLKGDFPILPSLKTSLFISFD